MIPLILQMFGLVLCYNTLTKSEIVNDYPNVYQKVHDEQIIERVRDIVSERPDLIYDYKVADEGYLLCARPYAQNDRYSQMVNRRP